MATPLISRRDAIVLSGAAAACATTPGDGPKPGANPTRIRSPEPPAWQASGAVDVETFPCGVQVGDATVSSAVVAIRTTTTLTLVVATGTEDTWTEFARLPDLAPLDGVVQIVLTDLPADTAISVAAYADDSRRSAVTRFRTALSDEADERVVTFGITSCLGGNEPWPGLTLAAAEKLDFFALIGDTVYADNATTLADYRADWDAALRIPGLIDVTASTSVIATWDDHEVGNDWSWETINAEQFAAARAAYLESLPQTAGPDGTSIWRKISWGKTLDIFILDCRGERIDGRYLSPEQMAWLKAQLSASKARFKIILNSVPITDLSTLFGAALQEDRWQGYPEERSEILAHTANIPGILWLAGDHHYGQIGHVDPEGGPAHDQWEVLCGPSGSNINLLATLYKGDDPQYTDVIAEWNWVRITCDPGLGTIRVQHIADDGTAVTDVTLSV